MEISGSIFKRSGQCKFMGTSRINCNYNDIFIVVQERWHHHHYLNSCWDTVVRLPQVWSTCPRRALYTETLLPGTSWWMMRQHARWVGCGKHESYMLNKHTLHNLHRLQTLVCPEICLIVTIMCPGEGKFLSSGQLLRYKLCYKISSI